MANQIVYRMLQWREWFLQYYGLAMPCTHENVIRPAYGQPLPRCPRCGHRIDREGKIHP